MREVAISEAKAHLLRLADEVARTGEELVITRRGRPLVRVVPVEPAPRTMAGSAWMTVDAEEFMKPFTGEWGDLA
ncbi:MAG: type II toxin-antitoxin system Phd/YefM family antitoxin [Thermoleophilia bacterium]|jgi:prevent-host-death family protein|nr:type II toxin-antitoxin system Phd/YefM family antitoxin [Thermoleophilia bacterium]